MTAHLSRRTLDTPMHELIAAPFLGEHFLLRPGAVNGVKLPRARYEELALAPSDMPCPSRTAEAARRAFGLNLTGRRLAETVLVRGRSPLGYSRASYELNLGCNWDCEHCYLGLKQFRGLAWDQRMAMLHAVRRGSRVSSAHGRCAADRPRL